MKTMKVGIIGCGKISGIYMENCHRFEVLELVAVADLDRKRAEEQAAAYNVPNVYSVDEILADPEIEPDHQPDDSFRSCGCMLAGA